jgi:predicted flavoprotein YhiN
MTDALFEKLFDNYTERKPRCQAAMLRYETVWDIAKFLREQGLGTKVTATGDIFELEVLKGEETMFIANVHEGDVIVFNDYANVSHVPGREFRRTWEKDQDA